MLFKNTQTGVVSARADAEERYLSCWQGEGMQAWLSLVLVASSFGQGF